MEILWWLVPSVVVTIVAMAWVSWAGRERREVDREEAVRRMGAALEGAGRPARTRKRQAPGYAVPERARDRSTGVAIRDKRAS